MYDIIVIGAGPAGMTAALYGCRAGKSVLVLEGENIGGQITFSPRVENYPSVKSISGNELANNLFEQISELGAEFLFEKVLKIDLGDVKTVVTDSGEYQAKAVILATGAKHRKLGLEGEDALLGRGVSYCAVCDGAFFKGKDVAVVGGGDTALQDALFLSAYCKKIYIIHRRDEFRGEKRLQERIFEKDNIELVLNAVPTSLKGDEELSGITVKSVLAESEKEIEVQGLFVAIGQVPANEVFKGIVKVNDDGYVIAGEDTKTSVPGIFVAGDCRRKELRQLATAVSDGAVAATAACEYADRIK